MQDIRTLMIVSERIKTSEILRDIVQKYSVEPKVTIVVGRRTRKVAKKANG